MKKIIPWILIISVVMALGIFGCAKERKEIKIGAILPLTGDAAKYGENSKRGIELALDEINQSDGINGNKINILFENSQADPKITVSIFQKMTTVNRIHFFIGPLTSSDVLAVAPLANEKRVIILAPAASAPQITNAGDYIFRSVMSDLFDGMAAASFVFNNLERKTAGVIYINNDFGVGLAQSFKGYFEKYGGEVVVSEAYNEEETDFRTQLTKIKRDNPQVVFLVGQSQMGYILRQAAELRIKTQWISISIFEDPQILQIAGKAAEGVYYTFRVFDPESQDSTVKTFSENYSKQYGQNPDIFAGLAYDAARILANAIEAGGTNVEKVKEALYNTKDFPGVVGKTTFDSNGDVIKPIGIKKVENGKFVWVDKNFRIGEK